MRLFDRVSGYSDLEAVIQPDGSLTARCVVSKCLEVEFRKNAPIDPTCMLPVCIPNEPLELAFQTALKLYGEA